MIYAGAGRGEWFPTLISWLTLIIFSAHEMWVRISESVYIFKLACKTCCSPEIPKTDWWLKLLLTSLSSTCQTFTNKEHPFHPASFPSALPWELHCLIKSWQSFSASHKNCVGRNSQPLNMSGAGQRLKYLWGTWHKAQRSTCLNSS